MMSIFKKKRGRPEQQMADLTRAIEDMQVQIQDMKKGDRVNGILSYLTANAKIDGTLSAGDVFVTVGAVFAISTLGGVIGVTQYVKYGSTQIIKSYWADATMYASILACIRIGADLMGLGNIARFVNEALDTWAEGRLAAETARVMAKEGIIDEPIPAGPPAVSMIRKKPSGARNAGQRVLLPNQLTISKAKMIEVIKRAVANNDTTDGKSWSRDYWCNDPDHPVRPGLNYISKRQWKGIKMFCEHYGIWRAETGEKDKVGDIVFEHIQAVGAK